LAYTSKTLTKKTLKKFGATFGIGAGQFPPCTHWDTPYQTLLSPQQLRIQHA